MPLLIVASLLPGCTVLGVRAGAAAASGPAPTAAQPNRKDSDRKAVAIGAAIGIALDVLVLRSMMSSGDFTLVPAGHDH